MCKVELKRTSAVCVVGKVWVSEKSQFVDTGSMFAFSGGAAIGSVANVFGFFDMFCCLRVFQILMLALTICFSDMSIRTKCVCGLGHWLASATCCAESSIWLGSSLGALAASETALLLEMALAQSRAVVALDGRTRFPQ